MHSTIPVYMTDFVTSRDFESPPLCHTQFHKSLHPLQAPPLFLSVTSFTDGSYDTVL
jgi:hypothetical protein